MKPASLAARPQRAGRACVGSAPATTTQARATSSQDRTSEMVVRAPSILRVRDRQHRPALVLLATAVLSAGRVPGSKRSKAVAGAHIRRALGRAGSSGSSKDKAAHSKLKLHCARNGNGWTCRSPSVVGLPPKITEQPPPRTIRCSCRLAYNDAVQEQADAIAPTEGSPPYARFGRRKVARRCVSRGNVERVGNNGWGGVFHPLPLLGHHGSKPCNVDDGDSTVFRFALTTF